MRRAFFRDSTCSIYWLVNIWIKIRMVHPEQTIPWFRLAVPHLNFSGVRRAVCAASALRELRCECGVSCVCCVGCEWCKIVLCALRVLAGGAGGSIYLHVDGALEHNSGHLLHVTGGTGRSGYVSHAYHSISMHARWFPHTPPDSHTYLVISHKYQSIPTHVQYFPCTMLIGFLHTPVCVPACRPLHTHAFKCAGSGPQTAVAEEAWSGSAVEYT